MKEKRRFKVEKLIRDHVSKHLRVSGIEMATRVLDHAEYLKCLKDKLSEEAEEVLNATSKAEMTEELADVLEVVQALSRAHDLSLEEIEKARTEKKRNKGGFEDRLYGSYVETDASNPNVRYYLAHPEKYPEC